MPYFDNQWKPNPKQAEFLAIPESIREAFYGGGANSGKSEVLLVYPLIRKYYQNPMFKMVFMRRTFPEIRQEILPRSQHLYNPFGAKLNKSEMCWTFPREDQYGSGAEPDGARIFLAHCQNEDDVHKYDSMEINLFAPDELTSYTEWIYLYIGFERVRAPRGSGLPAIIRGAGMPGGIGHSWVKERFVSPYPKGGRKIIGKGGNTRIYIHSTLADNPYASEDYAQSLEALPDAERNAKKHGSWDAFLGQVFREFRTKRFPDEPETALHVIEPFDIPSYWPRGIAMDWGYAKPAATSVGYFAISPDNRVILYDEDYFQERIIKDYCTQIKPKVDAADPVFFKLCKSAGQERGQEHSIQGEIEESLERKVELTTNLPGSRVAGKMLLHEYFRWKPKNKHEVERAPFNQDYAEFVLRNKGVDAYHEYLASFNPEPEETNLPKLLIFNHCEYVINAIQACSYDKTNPEDVAEFPGDDPYDMLRYGVDACARYFTLSSDKQEEAIKRQRYEDKLKNSGDWTAFYRNARLIENNRNNNPISVSTFHRGQRRRGVRMPWQ